MLRRFAIIFAICFVGVIKFGSCSRILAICPRASLSHQMVFHGLTSALSKRGHEIVFVTTDPRNDSSLKNYREIDIGLLYDSNIKDAPATTHWLKTFPKLAAMLDVQTNEILDHPEVRKLYAPDSDEHFDLILLELMYWPSLLPFAQRFDAPIIGLSPMGLPVNVQYTLGNPILISHPSNWELYSSSEPVSFYQRLDNWMTYWRYIYYYKTVFTPAQEAVARKYFGDDVADLNDLEKNVSLVFVNQQTAISHLKPNVPKMIEINGLHMSQQNTPLPENLRKILDEATQGFVYMSLGTNMKSNMLSKDKLDEFIAAFSRLPYKVLWKFENEVLPGKPDNVHIMKWVPQQDVLAHPNLKVFVYQGGLQSTEEAVTRGVPLVGIPTWADQRMQVDKMVSLGVARKLVMSAINRDDLENAILTVALNDSYKENMLRLRTLLRDNSHDLLENAIWWLEHVIRHKGAPHLHSSTADDPWYRRQDMDVVGFVAAGLTVSLGLVTFILYKFLVCVSSAYKHLILRRLKKLI